MSITNGYATLAEFKARTGLTTSQLTDKTTLIEREIERNSRTIDRITNTFFYSKTLTASQVRFDMGENADGLYMSEDARYIYFPAPILTLTAVTEDGTALVNDSDYIKGTNYITASNVFNYDRKIGIKITGTCGYSATPDVVNEICLAMTEVTTGLGTYTVIDEAGNKTELTRDNMPNWIDDRLNMFRRLYGYG